ncbi:MMPL family transporter [Propionibacteriaceae bacterium Y1700]|uniref:MMPL family transporter n=1 Tax=Microlunatus sp. Y1700 TaxID=3418487 RepID=UPI003DA70841
MLSSFLYALGRASFTHRWRVLIIWLAALAVIGGGAALVSKPFDESFTLPGTQSQDALDQLQRTFPEVGGTSAQMVIVAEQGRVDTPELKRAIDDEVDRLGDLDRVDQAASPFDEMVNGMVSDDGKAAIVSLQIPGTSMDMTDEDRKALLDEAADFESRVDGIDVLMGGEAFADNTPGVSIIEAVGVLIALIVLWLTLGSFRAAGMPLLTALLGVGISMALILGSTALATVSSTTPMLALMLGLAVGIDYALFILSRHREQLGSGMDPEESAAQSVATAGSAVVFAGLTVMIALVGLSVAQIPFLATMGVAAAAAVLVAVLIALTLLPALIGFAGEKLRPKPKRRRTASAADSAHVEQKLDQPGRQDHHGAAPAEIRGWTGVWVKAATKVPILTVAVIIVGLGALTLPAKDLALALPDNGSAAPGTPARETYDTVSEHFGEGFNGPLIVTADIVGSDDPLGVMDGLKEDIEAMPGVASVPLATPNRGADTGIVQVVPTSSPDSHETEQLVADLRAKAGDWSDEYEVDTAVTGFTAIGIDVSQRLGSALLPFGIFVVGLSLLLLTMVFRSIAVPIKATLGFLLSVGGAFGATALVFTHGYGAELINLHDVGPVISFYPIILMGVLFGLAMDYEVFLVSRIRENYVHGEESHSAVKSGFVSSAKVVVAAAVIMFAVFAFFVPEGEGAIKAIAFGLATGVFIDAFIVRMTLVPAVLTLLGDKAWWLPTWLDKRLPTFDVEGEGFRRQLALADWPFPGASGPIHVENLSAGDPEDPLFNGVTIDLHEGDTLVVAGGADCEALMLALGGRLTALRGRAKIAGQVLPDQASGVRRRTRVIDGRQPIADAVHAVLRDRPPLVLINHADQVTDGEQRRALAHLLNSDHQMGIVLGVASPALISDLVPPQAVQLDLAPTTALAAQQGA